MRSVLKVPTVLRVLVPRVLVVLMVPGAALAQDAGVIAGRVVDGVTGRPVVAAVVSMTGSSLVGVSSASPPPRILTGADGRFMFRGLPAGVFSVVATKGGYADGEPGRRRPGGTAPPIVISATDREFDVTVPMWKYGAIAGTVIDEAGEPVVALQVRALLRANGRREYSVAQTTFTDDRGAYRFGNLARGDYLVVASRPPFSANADALDYVSRTGRSNGKMTAILAPPQTGTVAAVNVGAALLATSRGYATPTPAIGARVRIYPPTFYPAAPDVVRASSIVIGAGDERAGIDIQIVPVPAARVSGLLLENGDPVPMAALSLVPGDSEHTPADAVASTSVSDGSGGFTFAGVVPGRYTLRVRGLTGNSLSFVEMPITVADDIDNLVVMMRPPLRVTAQTRFDGNTPPPGSPSASRFKPMPFLLEPLSGVLSEVTVAGVAGTLGDGSVTLIGFPPGRYRVQVADPPAGWVLKGAMLNGVDVSETPFDFTKDVTDLTLVFTDRWSVLNGRLDEPFGDGPAILVFTADTQAWTEAGPKSRLFRTARPNRTGGFSIRALPPGDYYVVAVPDEETADWRDPAMLESLTRMATRITIAEGEIKDVTLRVAHLR